MRRAALILVLGLLAAGCGGSASSGSQKNGPIVVSGGELDTPQGLFLREQDGSLRRLTTVRDGRDVFPAFSHDGKRIAFIRLMKDTEDGTGRLMVADADGKNAKQVGDVIAETFGIGWSPDDGSLVYSGLDKGLWTVAVDGSGAKHIFSRGGDASWSSDGRIVTALGVTGLTTMNEDGSDVRHLRRLAKPPKALLPDTYTSPMWSPDGKRIAYVLKVWTPNKMLLYPTTMETVDADGGDRRVVTKVFDSSGTTLSWSPDGKSIVFTDDRDGIPGTWVIPATGGKAKAVIYNNGNYSMPSWGPAGT